MSGVINKRLLSPGQSAYSIIGSYPELYICQIEFNKRAHTHRLDDANTNQSPLGTNPMYFNGICCYHLLIAQILRNKSE